MNMPIIKSAKKALRQSQKRRKLNLSRKNKVKEMVGQIKKLNLEGKKEEAEKLLSSAYKAIDKAAKRGVINSNLITIRHTSFIFMT